MLCSDVYVIKYKKGSKSLNKLLHADIRMNSFNPKDSWVLDAVFF